MNHKNFCSNYFKNMQNKMEILEINQKYTFFSKIINKFSYSLKDEEKFIPFLVKNKVCLTMKFYMSFNIKMKVLLRKIEEKKLFSAKSIFLIIFCLVIYIQLFKNPFIWI